MLILSRKVGEQICVPQLDVVLTVLEVRGGRVRLGITAPERISIVRRGFRDSSPQNTNLARDLENDATRSNASGPTMDDTTRFH